MYCGCGGGSVETRGSVGECWQAQVVRLLEGRVGSRNVYFGLLFPGGGISPQAG